MLNSKLEFWRRYNVIVWKRLVAKLWNAKIWRCLFVSFGVLVLTRLANQWPEAETTAYDFQPKFSTGCQCGDGNLYLPSRSYKHNSRSTRIGKYFEYELRSICKCDLQSFRSWMTTNDFQSLFKVDLPRGATTCSSRLYIGEQEWINLFGGQIILFGGNKMSLLGGNKMYCIDMTMNCFTELINYRHEWNNKHKNMQVLNSFIITFFDFRPILLLYLLCKQIYTTLQWKPL